MRYESLVIAVGSTANYFGIPGAAEHALALNGPEDAERFRLRMLKIDGAGRPAQAGDDRLPASTS